MGNQLGADRPAHHDYDLSDLGLVYDSRLGNGMFLKTIKCLHDEGAVVVKVYTKRPKENLTDHARALSEIRDNMQLVSTPNVFPYQKFIETEKAGYLVRQYFLNNLYDRISTRPFLSMIEKKWISFQLLSALSQIHFYGICHGDIKCENVLVTSANWVYLSDFAPYKPTFIPDNPAYFSFFFDSSGRRTCYLAPERFYNDKSVPEEGELTYQMDIFGMGCVIAELFLEGVPIFEYHQLLSYRKGEYNPYPVIQRIGDPHIEQLIMGIEPSQRLAASKYLVNYSKTVFPEYFQFMHKHVHQLLKMSPDERIVCIDSNFDNYIKIFTKQMNEQPTTSPRGPQEQPNVTNDQPTPVTKNDAFSLLMETEKFIKFHEAQAKTLSQSGSFRIPNQSPTPNNNNNNETPVSNDTPASDTNTNTTEGKSNEPHFPEILPTIHHDIKALSPYDIIDYTPAFVPPSGCEGLTILLGIVCSCMRATRLPSSKISALDLLRRFAIYLQDECRLQRIVPMLSDPRALVRASAIRTLAYVLDLVQTFPPSDSHIFPEYIIPALSHFPGEETEEIVRVAFAGSLAQLAETAKRFLETSQFFKQNDMTERKDVSYQASYDKELINLQDMFYDLVVEMLTKDTSSVVRRTLLTDITRVALFFGRQKTNDQVLPLIITFLNDRDWLLRCAFFHNIVGVSAFVGRSSLELFIFPCIMQALTDEEEFVIEKSISCLACLCELGLFRKHILLDIVHKTSPLLLHPNTWVRYGAMAIMEAVCKQLGLADIHCFVHPVLQPYLSYDVLDVTEQNLLLCLIPAVTRASYDKAVDLMFDFEGRQNTSNSNNQEAGSIPIQSHRSTIFRSRTQPTIDTPVAASAPTSAAIHTSLLHSSGVFSLDNSGDGSPPKNTNAKNRVFIGSQRRDSVEEPPPDMAAVLFTSKLDGMGINRDDQTKLLKMRDYLNSMTKAMLSRPKKSEDEELIARENSKHYSHTTAPVHVVLIPQPEASPSSQHSSTSYSGVKAEPSKPDLRYDNFSEHFSQTTREPTFIRVPRVNSPAFYEIREEGPPPIPAEQAASRSTLTAPPALPDLGTLECAPLNGDGLKDFKPKGILVAHLHEHKGPVVQVKVSADNMFFATGSHDGTVKIWDCQRLEKNVTNRSRLTYSSQGGKITSLAICENSHTIASGSDAGSIHVYKIECAGKRESGVHRYSGTSTLKNIEKTDPVVWVDHMENGSQSMVVYPIVHNILEFWFDLQRYATERGGVHSWDLRAKAEPFVLKNKPNLGLVQVCTLDPQRNWVVVGTSRGFITCWDLRFGIPISTWRHPSKGRIYKLAPYVSSSPYAQPRNSWIYVSTQGRDGVSVWDLESATCKMIFRVLTNEEEPPLPAVRPVPSAGALDFGLEDLQIPAQGPPDHPFFVKGLACSPQGGYLVTAGSDKRIRFWDLMNASSSSTVSGLRPEHPKPRYACSSNLIEGVQVFEEFPDVFLNQFSSPHDSSSTPSVSSPSAGGSGVASPSGPTPVPLSSYPSSTSLTPNTTVVAPGSGTQAPVGAAQGGYGAKQNKHRGPPVPSPNHADAILDVSLIELPHPMIVSCCRDGVVKVWK